MKKSKTNILVNQLEKTLLDNLPCIAMILKKGTREIVVSNLAARKVGAIPGKTCYKTCADRDNPCKFCLAAKLWATNKIQNVEVEYRGRYYKGMWVQYNDELYVHYIFDITEKKKSKIALKKSEISYKTLIKNTPGMIYYANPDWSAEIISNCKELCGYSPKEIDSMSMKWASIIHPKDREKVVKDGLNLVQKPGEFKQIYRINHKNNGIRWIEDHKTSRFSEDGNYLGIDGIAFDITEKKKVEETIRESEKKFRLMADSSHDLITIVDYNLNNLWANKSWKKIFGADLSDNNPFDQIYPDDKSKVIKRWEKFISSKKKVLKVEYRYKIPKSGYFIFETTAIKVYVEDQKLIYIAAHDITERKKYEKNLKDSQKIIEDEVKKKTKELQKANIKIIEYAKKLDLKIKRIEKKRVPLTDKEKLGFYGLVKFPDCSNKKIGDKIGLGETTVNAIRKRLIKEGYFKPIFIPRFDMLGCNLLSIAYTKLKSQDCFLPADCNHTLPIPEIILSISSEKERISINMSKSWNDFNNIQELIEEQNMRYDKSSYELFHFSADASSLINYFSFASIIKNRFDLKIEEHPDKESEHHDVKLTKNEKKIIIGLVDYPEMTIRQLSGKLDLSVPTVTRMTYSPT